MTDQPAWVIPDFAADAQAIAAFAAARERFERGEAQAAENEVRSSFQKRRDALQLEINTAESVIAERQDRAEKAVTAYARKYSKLVEKGKPRRPGFFQNLLSFGGAGRLYQATIDATADLNDARSLRRRKEHEDEELDKQLRRALSQLEEQLKERVNSPAHQEKFLSRPGNAEALKRVEAVHAERAAYAARLERGEVPPLEQRDRRIAQLAALPLEAPCTGLAIVAVDTFGELCYLIFRDREKRHFYAEYDARLEPLSDSVFDVYRIADRFEAKFHRRDGKPMSLADHLTEYLRDDEVARSEARKVRAALRVTRSLPPREAPPYKPVLDLLAELAKSAGRGAGNL
jgi:DNA repair exonuclease SbcCD ATPase subunit